MGKKIDKLVEGYKPIPMKRMFYPRKFNLSEDFVNAFHREYDRLVGEGQNPKSLVERFGKAMRFHQNETRKYHQLDEESAKQRQAKEQAAAKKRTHKRARQEGKKDVQLPAVDPATRDAQEDEHGNSRIT